MGTWARLEPPWPRNLTRRLESGHSNLTGDAWFARLPAMFEEWASLYDSVYAAKGKDYAAEAEYLQRWMGPSASVRVSAQATSERARGELPSARRTLSEVAGDSAGPDRHHTHIVPGLDEPQLPALLDVACGTGEHLSQLSGRFQLFGVDSSPEMLAVARHKLPGASLFLSNMTSFELGRSFDAITCLFSSIGYLRSVSMLERAIERMASHLSDDGVLLVEPPIAPERLAPPETTRFHFRHGGTRWERESSARVEGEFLRLRFTYRIVGHEPLAGAESFAGHEPVVEIGPVAAGSAGASQAAGSASPVEIVDEQAMRLFSDSEIARAMEKAGLDVEHDSRGPTGIGLWIGRKP
ncbi:MAG: class I SAM-dependent methyltransferase [Candidatus Eisenbacteria bacterium]